MKAFSKFILSRFLKSSNFFWKFWRTSTNVRAFWIFDFGAFLPFLKLMEIFELFDYCSFSFFYFWRLSFDCWSFSSFLGFGAFYFIFWFWSFLFFWVWSFLIFFKFSKVFFFLILELFLYFKFVLNFRTFYSFLTQEFEYFVFVNLYFWNFQWF